MKFASEPVPENEEVPLADNGEWERIVSQWKRREALPEPENGVNSCYVVVVAQKGTDVSPARVREIESLVRTQGDRVIGSEVVTIVRPNPRTLIGSGVARELGERALALEADMLVIDAELSPSQTRNLEDASGLPVADREGVILNVFFRHARSRRARIQVEIAHLEYLRPRIRGIGLEMDQQAGGVLGSRGKGETASELFARKIDGRLAVLRAAGKKVERIAASQRKGRDGTARVALVGYTNAGKTSLMNALTASTLSAADRPFETLDATSRALSRHGGDVLIADTVGFIRELPERLLASFDSTLDEIREATVLAVVVDLSDPEYPLHLETTERILSRLEASDVPRVCVFNKADLATRPSDAALELACKTEFAVVSSRSADDVAALRERLLAAARADHRAAEVFVPYAATEAMAIVHAKCRVLEAISVERGVQFRLEAPARVVSTLKTAVKGNA